jgi:superfamily I DNA/RNA helicase
MTTWLVPRSELTNEQIRSMELDTSQHRVILGAPGSGKSQLLLHRARYLRDKLSVSPDRFRIFVYTNALRAYIQSAVEFLGLPQDSVTTLDSWCRQFYEENIGRPPWDNNARQPDFAKIRSGVLARLTASRRQMFDFVLVDEGQDLELSAFELLKKMAVHVTVCMDHKQQIYDHGSEMTLVLQALGIRRSTLTLLETFRCCPYIVRLAARLVDDPIEREQYVRQLKTGQIERETPLLYEALDGNDERQKLIDIVRVRLGKGERIAVLFPQRRQAFGYAKALQESGIDVENPKKLDFTTDKPKLMPYHSAKGLTFDTVLLPRLTRDSFAHASSERITRLLFVGITRAIKWTYLSTTKPGDLPQLECLKRAAVERVLTIQKFGERPEVLLKPKQQETDVLDLL